MKRARRFVFFSVIAMLIFGVAGPAMATPDNISQEIRGQGSVTTYHLMQALDTAYNQADGCRQFVTSGNQRLDEVCVVNGPPYQVNASTGKTENWDHDVAFSDFALGSGNGRTLLTNFGNPGYPRIDYARSSSIDTTLTGAGYRFVTYAQDMLAYAIFVGNIKPATDPTHPCAVDRSAGAVFDDNGPLKTVHGPGHDDEGTWPIPQGAPSAAQCPAATPAGAIGEAAGPDSSTLTGPGQVVGGAVYPNLSAVQLKDIFACGTTTINDWSQLRGGTTGSGGDTADIPTGTKIVVWADQPGSGTKKDFDGKLGSGCDASNGIGPSGSQFRDGNSDNGERLIQENNAAPISGVPDTTAGGRKEKCETANRPTQVTADCAGTNTDTGSTPISYTQSFYYFSAGDWFASPAFTTNSLCSPTCNTDNTGNTLQGSGTVLGSLNNIDAIRDKEGPDCVNTTGGCYPYSRYIYNVYRATVGSGAADSTIAPDWVRDYVSELGWICRPTDAHETDPNTGVSYGTEIDNIIFAQGFALMKPIFGVGGAPVDLGGGVTGPSGSKCQVNKT